MKIILTGAGGNLGQAISRVYERKDVELVKFRNEIDLDLTNRLDVLGTIGAVKNADFLIHTAAYTNVDGAEKNPEAAFSVNSTGSQNIALACQQNGAVPVYISTDYVFDGRKNTAYDEFDQTNPINVYGRSKLAGEYYFQALLNKYFIIRTSWLFGPEGNNFVRRVYEEIKVKDELPVVYNHSGSPTLTDDLAQGIWEVMRSGAYGVFHLTNAETTTWYDWAGYILELMGEDKDKLRPVSWDDLGLPAARPVNSVLDNLNRRLQKLPPAPTWKEATAALLHRLTT